MTAGFLQTLLVDVRKHAQQVKRRLRDYNSCILQAIVCMDCSLGFQGPALGAVKLAKSSTVKVLL